jgi:hypothetical protein
VLKRVRQALHDSIGGEVDRARELEGVATDVEPDRQPGATDLFQQRVEAVEARLGPEFDAVAVAAHRPEEAAHLGERGAAGLLDAPKGILVLLERLRELVPDGPNLEHQRSSSEYDRA